MITIEEFILRTALYQPIPYSPESDLEQLFDLLYFNGTVDFYCTECERDSTFKGQNSLMFKWNNTNRSFHQYEKLKQQFPSHDSKQELELIRNSRTYHVVNLFCTRDHNHKAMIIFRVTDDSIIKVGQFPSIASQSLPDLKKYRAVLNNEKFKELKRAIGLYSHDVGVGAFVYLRRIFEDLINEAHQQAQASSDWSDEGFLDNRVTDKIASLRSFLPPFLVEHRSMYGILSKGVHELSEQDCLEAFPAVQMGIELILDQKLEALKRKDKEEKARRAISMLSEKLNK
ncbi:MAG: short-chain dehydrogenase [Bacteroidota bacterium]